MNRYYLLVVLSWFALAANAQEPADSNAGDVALPDEVAAQLSERSLTIDREVATIAQLERSVPDGETLAIIHQARIETARSTLFREVLGFARDVSEQAQQGFDVAAYRTEIAAYLSTMAEQLAAYGQRLQESFELPSADLSAAGQARADEEMGQLMERLDEVYAVMFSYTEIAPSFGLDPTPQRELLQRAAQDEAANRSAILDLALRQSDVTAAAAATVPDETELAGLASAADARVSIMSSALENSIALLGRLDLESDHYRQQLVRATGEVTADALDIGVLRGILQDWRETAAEFLSDDAPGLLFNLLVFVLIVAAAFYVGRLVSQLLTVLFSSPQVQMSNLAEKMIAKSARNAIVFVGLLVALSQLGVSLGPVLAGLGIAGFIVGFALQDTLSNFASGMLILIYRPFDVGDFVSAGGVTGRVSNMSLVNTTFKTPDNETLIVPNNKVWQDVIKNTTAQQTRRVDLTFGISYSDDIDRAKEILRDIAKNYESVLDDPPTDVRVNELADSSVNLLLRPWVRTADYWDTYWDLTEIVKKRFDAEGLTIPFPQREVHTIAGAAPKESPARREPTREEQTVGDHDGVERRTQDGQDLAMAADAGDEK